MVLRNNFLFGLILMLASCSKWHKMEKSKYDILIELSENNTPGMKGVVGFHLTFPNYNRHQDYGTIHIANDSFLFNEGSYYYGLSSTEVPSLYKKVGQSGIIGIAVDGNTESLKEPLFLEFELPNSIEPVRLTEEQRKVNLEKDLKINWKNNGENCHMDIEVIASYPNASDQNIFRFSGSDKGAFVIPKKSLIKLQSARSISIQLIRKKYSSAWSDDKSLLVEFITRKSLGSYLVVD